VSTHWLVLDPLPTKAKPLKSVPEKVADRPIDVWSTFAIV
jgi:hypothetical protein